MNCLRPQQVAFSCVVELLDGSELNIHFTGFEKGSALQQKVWKSLDLLERDYFGLKFSDTARKNEYWLDSQRNIFKQLKGVCDPETTRFQMAVKFYSPEPCVLDEEITRYQFYLQLRRDLYNGALSPPTHTTMELCALAAQGELGDISLTDVEDTGRYPSALKLLKTSSDELQHKIIDMHKQLFGLSPSDCEFKFLALCSKQEQYGIHFYSVKGAEDQEYKISMNANGFLIYKQNTRASLYLWKRIEGMQFKKKDFIIRVHNKKRTEILTLIFTCSSKLECKQLWRRGIEHHEFFRLRSDPQQTRTDNRVPPTVHRSSSLRSHRTQNKYKSTSCQTGEYLMLEYRNTSMKNQTENQKEGNSQRGLFSSGHASPVSVRSIKMKFSSRPRTSATSKSVAGDSQHSSNCECQCKCKSDDSESARSTRQTYSAARRRASQEKRRTSRSSAGSRTNSQSDCGYMLSLSQSGCSLDLSQRYNRSAGQRSHASPYPDDVFKALSNSHKQQRHGPGNYENISYNLVGEPILLTDSNNNGTLNPDLIHPKPIDQSISSYTLEMRHSKPQKPELSNNTSTIQNDHTMSFYEEKIHGRDSGTDSPTTHLSSTWLGAKQDKVRDFTLTAPMLSSIV